MSMADTFVAFMDGLDLMVQQQIAPHISTLAQAQTMVVKVDLYFAREGKDSGAETSGGKDDRGSGKFAGQKEKLGIVEENPQPDSVVIVAEKKKLQKLKKKSQVESKRLKKMNQVGKGGEALHKQLLQEGGAFF